MIRTIDDKIKDIFNVSKIKKTLPILQIPKYKVPGYKYKRIKVSKLQIRQKFDCIHVVYYHYKIQIDT